MVLDVSGTSDDSLASTDESVVAVEVMEATDVAVSMVVADSIDETKDVSVGAYEVTEIGLQGLAATKSTANRPKATRKRRTERITRKIMIKSDSS